LLASRDLPDARRALIGSGVFIIAQFALFLLVGTCLWLAGADRPGMAADAIYPTFVVEQFPAGLAGLVVAAILAAAMSTVSSSLNSLASASTHDFYAPLTGRSDPEHLLKVGRLTTLLWAVVLVGGAMLFKSRETPVVVLALGIASITYGGLLGSYLLGSLWRRTRQVDVVLAIFVGVLVMIPVVLGFPIRFLPGLALPWYVPLGTAVTMIVGMTSSMIGNGVGRLEGPQL
jgi:Na+/proline symporter